MKKIAVLLFFSVLFTLHLPAQTTSGDSNVPEPDNSKFPQWAKDLRRWDIILFGSFPFTMLTVTFITDMTRWNSANGMSWDDRRYAPWPLKSAGAISMTNKEQERTIWIAAGLSAAIAFTDLIIVLVKREKARKRAEALPSGSVIINRTPRPGEPATQDPPPQETAPQGTAPRGTEVQEPASQETAPQGAEAQEPVSRGTTPPGTGERQTELEEQET